MPSSIRTRGVLTMAAAAVLAVAAAVPAHAAPLSPNASIIHYLGNKAVLGTFSGGIYTAKKTVKVGKGWTDIAVGRDTMAMYNATNGRLDMGRFRNGSYRLNYSTKIPAGFTHLAASCDSIMFYNRRTGKARTYRLGRGLVVLSSEKKITIGKGYRIVDASCDTVFFVKRADGEGTVNVKTGRLKDGRYVDKSNGEVWSTPTLAAATTDSFVAVDVPDGIGIWGTATNGVVASTLGASTFFTGWEIVAGSMDSLYWYDSDPVRGEISILSQGDYAFIGAAPDVPAGVTLIAAGR
jgi:hypothetical protein